MIFIFKISPERHRKFIAAILKFYRMAAMNCLYRSGTSFFFSILRNKRKLNSINYNLQFTAYPVHRPSMHSSEMIQHRIGNDAVVVSSSTTSSPINHFFPEIFARNISISVLIKVASLVRVSFLTAAIADHASSHLLLLLMSVVVSVSVMLRLVFVPFGEVSLTVSIMRRKWCWSLITVLALIIVL
jgi:hypothetical protein